MLRTAGYELCLKLMSIITIMNSIWQYRADRQRPEIPGEAVDQSVFMLVACNTSSHICTDHMF